MKRDGKEYQDRQAGYDTNPCQRHTDRKHQGEPSAVIERSRRLSWNWRVKNSRKVTRERVFVLQTERHIAPQAYHHGHVVRYS